MITNKEKYILSKDITNMIKGIAIILMMTHHFLGFPNWLIDGINYPNYKIYGEYNQVDTNDITMDDIEYLAGMVDSIYFYMLQDVGEFI